MPGQGIRSPIEKGWGQNTSGEVQLQKLSSRLFEEPANMPTRKFFLSFSASVPISWMQSLSQGFGDIVF